MEQERFFGAINPESPTAEIPCHTCHGSGELIRPLTLGEAVEVLKDTIEALERVAPYHDEKILYVALPDGSRVRRGK